MTDSVWQDMAELLVAHEHHPVYGPRLRRIAERMRELDEFQATIHAAMPALEYPTSLDTLKNDSATSIDVPLKEAEHVIDARKPGFLKSADGSELAVRAVDIPADEATDVAIPRPDSEGNELSSTEDSRPGNQGKRTGKRRIS